MRKLMLLLIGLAIWPAPAFATTIGLNGVTTSTDPIFVSGSNSVIKIGDQIGSLDDQFNITGISGSFSNAGQLGVNVGTGEFVVGPNCTTCALTPSGTLTQSLSVNGSAAQDFVIGWSWSSTGPFDTLTLAIVTGTLNFAGWVASLNPIPSSISSPGGITPFALNADFVPVSPVSLPAALPLFLGGLAGLGWLGRRKRKQFAA